MKKTARILGITCVLVLAAFMATDVQPAAASPGNLEFCFVECTPCGQAGCNDCVPDPNNIGCVMCKDCPWQPWG